MRIVTHNFRLKALSMILALVTWGGVVYAANPAQSLSIRVPIGTVGHLPEGLVATSGLGQVSATVVGLSSSLAAFRRESLHAGVDVSQAHLGSNHLPVRVLDDDKDVTVRDFQPAFVELTVDQLGTAVKTVDIRLTGTAASGYVPGARTALPASVTLTGPQTVLQSAVAYVSINVADRSADLQVIAQVKVEKPDHAQLGSIVAAQPSQVQVTVPFGRAKVPTKVALLGNITGQPAAGFHITGTVDVTPNLVTVQGDPAVIAKLTSIELDPVDIGGRTSDTTRTVTLRLPPGIEALTPTQVIETVHIAADPTPQPKPTPTPSPTPSASPSP